MTQEMDVQAGGPDVITSDPALDGYTAAMASGAAPLLGHLVLYTIHEADVTVDDVERWFRELGLDLAYVPRPLRPADAFERTTGPNGVKVNYPLADPASAGQPKGGRRRRESGEKVQLMVRNVRRDRDAIVRHVVREVRDPGEQELAYDTRLAVVMFVPDPHGRGEGAGTMSVTPDQGAIGKLGEAERQVVQAMLFEIEEQFRRRCTYLSAARLRAVVREYIEALRGLPVQAGAYFVHRENSEPLAALREFVGQIEGKSSLTRIPLPDQSEMREMVETAVSTRATEELKALARDIAAAQREGKGAAALQGLTARYATLNERTQQHTELLSTSLDEAQAALDLVKKQLAGLMVSPGEE